MKKFLCALSCLSICLSNVCASSLPAEVPISAFAIGESAIGVQTFADIQKIFGAAKSVRISKEDGADLVMCYVHIASKRKAFLIFESGEMGGSERYITGFRLSVLPPQWGCTPTTVEIGGLKTRNGIYLGQISKDFQSKFPIRFTRKAGDFRYEGSSRRVATAEELKRIRSQWPDTSQDYFDVTISIEAKFGSDRLVDYRIRKIESF